MTKKLNKLGLINEMDRESFFQPPQGKILRAPSLKRGKPEERITDRVSFFFLLHFHAE